MLIDLIENLLLTVAFGLFAFAAAADLAVRVLFAGMFPARVMALGQAPIMAPGEMPDGTGRRLFGCSRYPLGSLQCNGLPAQTRRQATGAGQF